MENPMANNSRGLIYPRPGWSRRMRFWLWVGEYLASLALGLAFSLLALVVMVLMWLVKEKGL